MLAEREHGDATRLRVELMLVEDLDVGRRDLSELNLHGAHPAGFGGLARMSAGGAEVRREIQPVYSHCLVDAGTRRHSRDSPATPETHLDRFQCFPRCGYEGSRTRKPTIHAGLRLFAGHVAESVRVFQDRPVRPLRHPADGPDYRAG